MASILQVYEGVKDLINKEQKGFITPSVFNSFAQAAQSKIFNSLMNEAVTAKKLAKQGVDVGEGISFRERKKEDLNVFVTSSNYDNVSDNVVDLPKYSAKIISIIDRGYTEEIQPVDEDGNLSGEPYTITVMNNDPDSLYEILNDQRLIQHVQISNLSAPTSGYRVALVTDKITLYPEAELITVYYYSPVLSKNTIDQSVTKSSPFYAINVFLDAGEVYSPDQSRDFILPEHYVPELIYEIALMCGVRLRDQQVVSYVQQQIAPEA
jgi:hypothetical protein